MAVKDPSPLPPRSCGDCGLCCKLLAVEALAKPAHRWCSHFAAGSGCGIYADRPGECRSFRCIWLMQADLGPHWQPSRSHMVMYFAEDGTHLVVSVDPGYPGAWREAPYHEALRDWARRGLGEGLQVIVKIGRRMVLVLPDRDVELGTMADGEHLRLSRATSERGVELTVRAVRSAEVP